MANKQHVIFLNYQISIELLDLDNDNKIIIEVKDVNTNNIYVGTIKDTDITTQPLKKFYNILLKGFNLEKNYLITIKLNETNLNKLIIECKINFDDLFEINEIITLENVDDIRNNDLQKLEQKFNKKLEQTIKEQENKINELEKQIFKLKTKHAGIYIMTTQNSKNSSMIKYLKVLKLYLYPDKIEYIFWVDDMHNYGLIQIPVFLPKQCKQINIINCKANYNLDYILVQIFITDTCYFYDYCSNSHGYSVVKYLEIEFDYIEINKMFFDNLDTHTSLKLNARKLYNNVVAKNKKIIN